MTGATCFSYGECKLLSPGCENITSATL